MDFLQKYFVNKDAYLNKKDKGGQDMFMAILKINHMFDYNQNKGILSDEGESFVNEIKSKVNFK